MKNVLILGAGMVAKPIVKYLLDKGYNVTLADMYAAKAEKIIAGHKNGRFVKWLVEDEAKLDKMIPENDIVVSLLPYVYHVIIAKHCIKHKKNMVTTSYVKPEMKALDNEAKQAGIIILNEAGLDPGLDHMSAKRLIDKIHSDGGKVDEFYSLCGALPAPESADNPFKYKFSWSPKGVVMAGNNDAKFLKNGKIIERKNEELFRRPFSINFPEVGQLEVYPNRNSLLYIDIYGIQETKTIYRGTLRYEGWCRIMNAIKALNLLSEEKINVKGKTYAKLIVGIIGTEDIYDIRQKVADYLLIRYNAYSLMGMEWLGLFDNVEINKTNASPLEIVSDLMIEKMMLKDDERDMVVLQHSLVIINNKGNKELITSRLLDFGSMKTDTAISRTVALPAAIATEMILTNKINLKGVYIPVLPELYNPILDNLEEININMVEEKLGIRNKILTTKSHKGVEI